MITDIHNRTFKTLRISLIGLCNLGCVYCVSNNEKKPLYRKKALSHLEIIDIITKLHQLLGLKTIRLTGGEPTLYPRLTELIEGLSPLQIDLKMTTNGYNLEKLITPIYDAGLKHINISLDTINESTFKKISNRTKVSKILESIEKCKEKGFIIKLNTVIIRGINDHEIIDILNYAHQLDVPVRFLELMKMGHLFSDDHKKYYFSEQEILESIKSEYSISKDIRTPHATANYFSINNKKYKFGIIANESEPFCSDCDRLRLDISGNIYGCLSDNHPLDISEDFRNDNSLAQKLQMALLQKQTDFFKGSKLSMLAIGG